jgi:hypothetical protein
VPMRSEGQHVLFGRVVSVVTEVKFDTGAA